jgi:hypothetical protein
MMPRTVTSRGSCEGSQVTGNTTIPYNGNDIGVVTGSCSPSGSTKRSTLEGRQYSLCTEGTCKCFPPSPSLSSGWSCLARDYQLRMFAQVLSPVRTRLTTRYTGPTAITSSNTSRPIRVSFPIQILFKLFLSSPRLSFGAARIHRHYTRLLIP